MQHLGGGCVGEEALAIGLYSAIKGKDFRDALRISARHSGDSDSTAAIAGQILGVWRGLEMIPVGWQKCVELSNILLGLAERIERKDSTRASGGRRHER